MCVQEVGSTGVNCFSELRLQSSGRFF